MRNHSLTKILSTVDKKSTKTAADAHMDAIRGCLIGGAVGDALGYAVEFWDEELIFSQYGPNGITAYDTDPASGKALISDDTQMSLFTANGLLTGLTRGRERGIMAAPRTYVAKAYQDWLKTQICSMQEVNRNKQNTEEDESSRLLNVPELYFRRAPGKTCLTALSENEWYEDYIAAVRNDSKGCGGIMRVAPLGLCNLYSDIRELDREGAQLAAITHGHSLGYMPAAVLVHIINRIVYPPEGRRMTLDQIVLEARDTIAEIFAGDENLPALVEIINRAMQLAKEPDTDDLDCIHQLGEGWVAEETLGIALYCALRHQDDFSAGVIAAVNHNGDSDSTGAVTGNILGAMIGYEAIEEKWKRDLELKDVILEMAEDLSQGTRIADLSDSK